MIRLALAAFLLAAAGCGDAGTDPDPVTPEPGTVEVQSNEADTGVRTPDLAADADTTGPARVEMAGATVPTRGVVTDIESGDRSCYITLRTDGGASETVHADYSVCDSNAILDRRVQVEYVASDVMAESCGGDPDCLDTETVALAVVAAPID